MKNKRKYQYRASLPEYFKGYIEQIKNFSEEDLVSMFEESHVSAREQANEEDIPFNQIRTYWIKKPGLSTHVHIDHKKPNLTKKWIKDCMKELYDELEIPKHIDIKYESNNSRVLRLIITDVHVSMETNYSGLSLYGGVWNEEELFIRLEDVLEKAEILKRKNKNNPFTEIHVIDLGDYMDGWDSMTTRKGHSLPQNMNNRKAFKVGTSFKIQLLESLQNMFGVLVKNYNVNNDNHSSDFGYIVNESVKNFVESKNQNIEVYNLEKFMNYYFIGRHGFILCHGKDESHMKHGYKSQLDSGTKEKIENYINFHKLNQIGETITFEKGDSHQQILDYSSSDMFNYFNYFAFSPSSDWVQTNFKRGKSGYSYMIVDQDLDEHQLMSYTFKWKSQEVEA